MRDVTKRSMPSLTANQVVNLQDALLSNADRLLRAALTLLELQNAGLARSLAILGMEESGKAIALHERRVQMAYQPEGEAFVDATLERLWASHQRKLELVHRFLKEERYWFGTEPSNPQDNADYLGAIERWTQRHNQLKQRGFYVDTDKAGGVLEPTGVSEEESLQDVIRHVHQIGWQLRLGEHIEASAQAAEEKGIEPASEADISEMRQVLADMRLEARETVLAGMRTRSQGRKLNNAAYRVRHNAQPFENLGRPGYEAETRELMQLADGLDRDANGD